MNAHPTGPPTDHQHQLAAALDALADRLATLPRGLEVHGVDLAEGHRHRLVRDVRAAASRSRDREAPLLVVLGGVTGAGKSTVTNSLVGRPVVETGVVRPTTATPTLVVHPEDRPWSGSDRVLPDLPRASSVAGTAAGEVLLVVEDEAVPRGVALIDAPDVDSVSDANQALADRLLDASDVWLWFTTVGKYADEESMRYIQRAVGRDTSLAVALTQVRDGDRAEIVADLRRKLVDVGAGDARIVVVPWSEVVDARLPDAALVEIRGLLDPLADPDARRAHRERTLRGAVATLPAELRVVTRSLAAQLDEVRLLTDEAARAYTRAGRDFAAALEEGLPLEAEVLSRWNRFVGGGRILRMAEGVSGQARSWLSSVLDATADSREERLEQEVKVEVADQVGDLATRVADLAAADTTDAWSSRPAGAELLRQDPDLRTSSPDLRSRTEAAVAEWQAHVVELVATRGAERRTRARWMTTVLNAAATGAIVVALAQTGGLTGAEAGIAGVAGAANQTLLTKLLGAQNLRWLIATARQDLAERFDRVLAAERQRYGRAVAERAPDPDLIEHLRDALTAVEEASA